MAASLLRIAQAIDKRVWWFESPLRQFREVQPTGEKKPCTTCGKKKAAAENIVQEEASAEVTEVTE